MIEIVADLHSHTNACGHGFSSFKEMIDWGNERLDLAGLAITEHGPEISDSPGNNYFYVITRMPGVYEHNKKAFFVLRGAEANVLNTAGSLDLKQFFQENLDWVIASMHKSCLEPMPVQECTEAWLKVAQNPYVDMIGHPEQDIFKFDYDRVCKEFAANGKVVEFNASSIISRPGNEKNMLMLAESCLKHDAYIAVNSDAHSCFEMANWQHLLDMLKELKYPEELIVNSSLPRLAKVLKEHGRMPAYENVLKVHSLRSGKKWQAI